MLLIDPVSFANCCVSIAYRNELFIRCLGTGQGNKTTSIS